ncbi:MAG TPA: serine/threonine-protein kinase, partial [Lacipirellulaceae bacterium]|nr:serine/threonine-protein kinase [Lacipirellulaceae bacterium]
GGASPPPLNEKSCRPPNHQRLTYSQLRMQITRLGPYDIGEPLGKGGMGSVYAAINTQTGDRVAVKALTPHLAMAEGFRERFEAEIESLKILRHEGIVRLFGYGEQDGILFYSMELVDGISLEDELKAGRRFNWREVSNIAIQLSLALKHAHDHGIVHRDIKPANILLYKEDRVKLADFGIARLFGTTQLTTAGGVLGTADYMSPEQADGRPVTARCDQYSLGGVMYALLAGRPPFRAKSLPQMLQLQRFASPEPVRRYAPDTPEQLERVIMQLLAKNPSERYPNTQVLARHLQAMVMALSRPAHDDFALENEHRDAGASDPKVDYSMAVDVTKSESQISHVDGAGQSAIEPQPAARKIDSHNAATLAAEELKQERAPAANGSPPAVATVDGAAPPPSARSVRFTTIEAEEARLRAEQQRSWITVALQLAGLAAVLGGMAALALYLSRPPTADELYQTITSNTSADDDTSLGNVEREINEFLAMYPKDSRAAELVRYREQVLLDKMERKLQREARGNGSAESQLIPAERLYLRAVGMANETPEAAAATLKSLMDLYGAEATRGGGDDTANSQTTRPHDDDARKRIKIVVQLAKRRLATLQTTIAKERNVQLADLKERIQAAERLVKRDPDRAAAMYQAIIDLHANDGWAADLVQKARDQLTELQE